MRTNGVANRMVEAGSSQPCVERSSTAGSPSLTTLVDIFALTTTPEAAAGTGQARRSHPSPPRSVNIQHELYEPRPAKNHDGRDGSVL